MEINLSYYCPEDVVRVLKILTTKKLWIISRKTKCLLSRLLQSNIIFHSSSHKSTKFLKRQQNHAINSWIPTCSIRAPFMRVHAVRLRFPFKMAATMKKGVVWVHIKCFLSRFMTIFFCVLSSMLVVQEYLNRCTR